MRMDLQQKIADLQEVTLCTLFLSVLVFLKMGEHKSVYIVPLWGLKVSIL